MIENNNPDIDAEQLIAQIQTEVGLKEPRHHRAAPYVPPKAFAASRWRRKLRAALSLSAWRERVRGIPFAGGIARWAYNLFKLPELKRYMLGRLDLLAARQEALSRGHEKAAMQLDRIFSELEQTRAELEQTRAELGQQSAWLRQELHRTQRNCGQAGEPGRGAAPGAAMSGRGSAMLDAYYLAFENAFRGDCADIRSRLEVYLPYLHRAGAGTSAHPVLDIGCGRGEWLELLKDNGLVASGIDLNAVMAELCREQGLDVERADVLGYLEGLPDGKLGAVTGFHIIEHLPFEQLLSLLDEVLRVLKPGGIAIFETPNPENLMVGAFSFYNDPTHRNPLPPQVVDFMARQRGFAVTEILRLHPYPNEMRLTETSAAADRINHLFYGPQDYALIATKSHET